ncbi:MAG: PAS domain S-box protein [Terriglobia bacterium]
MKSARQILLSLVHATQSLTQRVIGRRGIRVREPLAYVLAFALVVVTVGVFLRFHIAGTYQEEMAYWRARQASVADDRAHWISDWLTERQADAELISSFPLVRAALRVHYDAGQPWGRPAVRLPELTAVLDEMAGLYSYSGVYVLDREARVVAQSNYATPLSPLLAETCRDAARTNGRRIDLLGGAPDRSLISFSVPVFPESAPTATGRPPAQPLGIALVVVEAARTIFPLLTRQGVLTQTGETLLVRREGDEVIFFSPLRHIPAGSPNLRFPLSTAPLPARRAVEGLATFVEYNDYWGAPVLATTRYIPLTEWGIVQKINRAEALHDFYRMAIVEGLAAGLLIILLGGLLLFYRRDVLTRVLKREEAKFRALLESAPDAMVIADGEGRVVLLNAQAETMFGFRRKELIGLGLRMLFPEWAHVQPGGSLPWDFSTEVAQQVGKTMEMHGLRKDGAKFLLEARLGRIETAEGPAFSCVIRDITERQRAEAEMAERHRLAALVAEVGAALTGAESLRQGLQQCAEILVRDINAAFARIWTVNEADKVLELQASAGMYTHLDGGHARVPMGQFKIGRIAENGEPHLTNTVQQDSWVGDPEWARREGMVAFAGYPLRVGEHVLGVVAAFALKPLTTAALQAFASVADNLAQFIERKRAEEALRESEEKYRALIETTGTGYVIIDTQGRVVDANPEYVRLTGRRALHEILGHRIAEWTAQHDLARTAEAVRRCAELGFTRNFEIEHVNGDGKCIPIEVNATVVLVAGAVRMVGLCRDITERKRAEEALRESEARYRRLFEQNLAGVFRGTLDGHVLDCNNAYARMLGYNSPQEILELEKLDYFYDAQEGMAAIARLRREGSHANLELRLKCRDGSPISVLSNVTLTEMGESGLLLVEGTLIDITMRKRAEESHAFLASLVESSQDAIISTTLEALTVSWNHGAEELYGYSAEEMIGSYVSVLYPPDRLAELAQLLEKVRQGKRINCYESVRVRKDGTRVNVSLTFSPVYDTTGRITGTVTIARDITERQRAEAEMAERHRLETLVAEVGVALTGAESLRQGLQECAEILVRDINAALARIWTVNEEDKVLELEASAGMYTHLDGGHARVPMGQLKIGRIAESGEPHLTNTVQQDSGVRDPEWARREGMVAFAGYPLRVGEHVLGVVAAFARQPLTPATLQAFASVAHNLAQFIKRKRVEETLRESEEKYRALIETTGTGYVIIDTQGRVVDANAEYVRLTGRRALHEVLGHRITEWTAQHDLARTAEAVRRCAELGFTRNFDMEHVNGDGKCTPIEVDATVVVTTGGVRIVGLCRDITERKRAEEALRASEERYRELFENASDLVYTTDLEGRLTSLNRVAEQTLAYSREEAAQMNLRQLVDPRHWQRVEQTRERLLAGDSAVTLELEITAKDGRRVMLEVNPRLIYKDGKPVGMQGIGRDITGREEREMELRHAQKLESVGRLASGIAHEINTPIQFVGDNTRFVQDSFGGLHTLLSKYQELRDAAAAGAVSPDLLAAVRRVEEESDCAYLLEEIPKALTQTLDGVTRVATLVRAMKDFAHPESKEKAAADLNKALLSTLTVARNELKYVADVETDLGDLPPVVCNISDLNQVFLNLLVNAAHAISEVVKGSGEKGKIRVRTVAEDNTVLVTITDTGCGIPEGIRTKVFDPFFTTKEVGRGTGQGLAIARSVVVERHKGTLTFESEVGKGTTFYICLPLEPGECSREMKVQ